MRKLSFIELLVAFICMMSCRGTRDIERTELLSLERKGFSIHLDSNPITFAMIYLNEDNVSEVKIERKKKYVNISRKNTDSKFHTVTDLINQKEYKTVIDLINVDGLVLDSVMIQEARFEDGAVRYMRLLTQEDYGGKEFDDLPQVRQTIGNGLLIINTR